MLIGILQTGQAPDVLRPETGDYPDFFATLLDGHGFAFRTWHVEAMDFPVGIHDADGWLITGSRHGAYEDHPFIAPLERLIRDIVAGGVPLVGICFGHQIIAQALGGKVERSDRGWAVGATDYDFAGETMTLNAWHRDQVVAVPPGARVVASNDFCANAALVYDDRAFTVQAHPEFRPQFIDGLMRTRGPGLVPEPLMAEARAKLDAPIDDRSMAGRIAAFFKMPRARRPAA
ncbi:MAG: type 1 glutamine amidotransferase [Gemmobacter sp.]